MFTGIIQAFGKVLEYDDDRLWISVPFKKLVLGESISINGVCLTVAAVRKNAAAFDVGPETRRITTLGGLKTGDQIHLERALKVGDALGGHWVTGHVEATATIERTERDGKNRWLTIKIPASIKRYVVSKGSLAVDGISLTIVSVRGVLVRFMLVPHTLRQTNLGSQPPGHRVNVEPDILAKYVLR